MEGMMGHRGIAAPLARLGRIGTLVGLGMLLSVASTATAALPPVPVPPENPITESKRVLGKILFWDEQLSTSMAVSCGTCHVPGRSGTDPRIATNAGLDNVIGTPDDVVGSPGVLKSDSTNAFLRDSIYALRPQVTTRNSQSNINSAYAPELFWDGRAKSEFRDPMTNQVLIAAGGALENQAIGPIVNNVEMAHAGLGWTDVISRLKKVQPLALGTNRPTDVVTALSDKPNYAELFRRAFGSQDITAGRIAMAIATYQRTLNSDQAPYDRFLAGIPGSMTPQQVQGLNAFQASNCSQCHQFNGGLFTDFSYRNIGLRPSAQDRGRAEITGNNADRGKFKVPGLRNVGLKRTFMHTGQFTNLGQVLGFYARAPGAPVQVPENIDPIMATVNVPPQAANVIGDFLANGLLDPRVAQQTFPFDMPTLFADRIDDQATILGGAVAETGSVAPAIIVQSPALVGNLDFRIGLDVPAAMAGKQAVLAVSTNPPVNGRVIATEFKGPVTPVAHAAGANATFKWPLTPGAVTAGQTLYLQWQIASPLAAGGEARSQVAQITLFCGSMGCPPKCVADYDASQVLSIDDIFVFLNAWFAGNARTDVLDDGAVDIDDIFKFLNLWFAGC